MLSFTGIGSGLAVSDIVDALVGAERTPFESRLNRKESQITTDISAVGALKSALEAVKESMANLADADNYQQRSVSGADSFINISSNKDAEVGSYTVKVDALAQKHKLVSDAIVSTDPVGEGTITLNSGDNTFDIAVSDTATLSEIRDAINDSDDNESVIATIITDNTGQHLVLSSKDSGVANAITVTVDDVDTNHTNNIGLSRLASVNLTEATAAVDAQITVDNTIVVTSDTNVFTNVIDGLDITAKKTQEIDDSVSSVSVRENNSNIESGLNSFITSYNDFVALAKNLGRAGESGSGPLAGDSLLRGVMGKLRQELSSSFDMGNGQSISLSELGVRSDQYGVLSLDEEDLESFIESDIDGIQQFFVGTDSSDGFASSLDELVGFYTDSDGIIQGRLDSKAGQLDKIDDERIVFGRKMEALESRLLAQYNAMDLLVANLNATSSYVQAQLDNMPGVVRNNNN
jgi:flagellar hook-associated protein 2